MGNWSQNEHGRVKQLSTLVFYLFKILGQGFMLGKERDNSFIEIVSEIYTVMCVCVLNLDLCTIIMDFLKTMTRWIIHFI